MFYGSTNTLNNNIMSGMQRQKNLFQSKTLLVLILPYNFFFSLHFAF